ncbi:hypothetical protein WR25_11000 [Diploscapter pachys]|uniref:ShKT domain-containing protein n=1 Tax=Diploscapter pachys TaxID=2018661 RepID=A0A2A2LRH4_9BILA|nr:hypothetical protein WR25_11000 [Diploscapter pachys]
MRRSIKANCVNYDRQYNFCASNVTIENKRFICAKTCNVCIEPTTEAPVTTSEHPETTTKPIKTSSTLLTTVNDFSTEKTEAFTDEPTGPSTIETGPPQTTTDFVETSSLHSTEIVTKPFDNSFEDDSLTTTELPQPNTSVGPDDGNVTNVTTARPYCRDDYENCERFNQRYRFCDSDANIEFKRFVCAKTCGVCIETTTSSTTTTTAIPTTTHKIFRDDPDSTTNSQTTTEATTTSVCNDDYENCEAFNQRYNFCASDASTEFKRFVCEKTCGLCFHNTNTTEAPNDAITDVSETTQATEAPSTVSAKNDSKCYDTVGIFNCLWLDYRDGFCTKQPESYKKQVCAMTCNLCENLPPHPGPDSCVDYLDMLDIPYSSQEGYLKCSHWRNFGLCNNIYQPYYNEKSKYYCAKSCNMC